jgi:gliding motility-associated-like protein
MAFTGRTQTCNERGQKPSTAFPVCGTNVFKQTTVPLCAGRSLPSPSCNADDLKDVNPYWYKFTCFEAGTLGFTITPVNLSDDYDWELYDVTGRNPDDIYTDGKLVVSSNWSGEGGKTGASSTGRSKFVCAGWGKDLYSSMPALQKGHNYLLLISHFTQSQSGYDLQFSGGSAVITDTLIPKFKNAEAACSGNIIRLKLNKTIKCATVSLDGSDFSISNGAGIISANAIGCAGGFDSDSIEIKLSSNLGPGTYRLLSKKGGDGNTLLDICDNPVADNESINFTVFPIAPTPMDSMVPLACAPASIKLHFRKPIACSSIAKDGSDFRIQGSYAVSITGAAGVCNGGSTREIVITLAKPIQQKGSFKLVLQKGMDGNTLLDECAQETPIGSSLDFSVKDTVDAGFTYRIRYGCTRDTVEYFHNGDKEVNKWTWDLADNKQSPDQNPVAHYTLFNSKAVSLVVSNGFCTDSSKQNILLANFLKADFDVVPDNCPSEPVAFTSTALGKINDHQWKFGDGGTSNTISPQHTYSPPQREITHQVQYTVTDSFGCQQTITKPIIIYSSCTVFIPNAFTPNGDGKNDVFGVINAVKADQFQLVIYNRWGGLVFRSNNWKDTWDGKVNGLQQAAGTFVWFVKYVDKRTNEKVERKGSLVLIR